MVQRLFLQMRGGMVTWEGTWEHRENYDKIQVIVTAAEPRLPLSRWNNQMLVNRRQRLKKTVDL